MPAPFKDFVALVKRLREECPWDREQTHESIRESLIEEAYEVVDAIDRQDFDDLRNELGDVLLNVVFHAVMADETGKFSINDVFESETQKLIARHPHVFQETVAEDQETVLKNWETIKRGEKGRVSILDGIPAALPALQFAHRMQSKAARVGFDFPSARHAWSKVEEELEELAAIDDSESEKFSDELGDLLFAIVNYARLRGASAETALRLTNTKFLRRFRFVEEQVEESGSRLENATLDEMDALWDQAKRIEDD